MIKSFEIDEQVEVETQERFNSNALGGKGSSRYGFIAHYYTVQVVSHRCPDHTHKMSHPSHIFEILTLNYYDIM